MDLIGNSKERAGHGCPPPRAHPPLLFVRGSGDGEGNLCADLRCRRRTYPPASSPLPLRLPRCREVHQHTKPEVRKPTGELCQTLFKRKRQKMESRHVSEL
ncbi:unnamed protein product [Victoria cruziana]